MGNGRVYEEIAWVYWKECKQNEIKYEGFTAKYSCQLLENWARYKSITVILAIINIINRKQLIKQNDPRITTNIPKSETI